MSHKEDEPGKDPVDNADLSRHARYIARRDKARLMHNEGKSDRAIAARLGVSRRSVSDYLQGHRRPQLKAVKIRKVKRPKEWRDKLLSGVYCPACGAEVCRNCGKHLCLHETTYGGACATCFFGSPAAA